MSWLAALFLVAGSLVIVVNILGAGLLAFHKESPMPEAGPLPKVAILIAARNEAATLKRCLHAISQLNYPKELLSVWVGNDGSTDATYEIATTICQAHSSWHVLDIKEQWGQAKGKANVLAQLARAAEASADYYFFTDADIAVSPDWVLNMLPYFTAKVAMVNGTTVVEGNHWFYRLQRYDWALAMGLAKAYTYLPKIGKPITAIGNNMAIRKEAYVAIGGYENIPFSITEDYELHRQVNKLGYLSCHSSSEGTKAFSLPAKGFKELLHQRKRWMTGAMQLPLPMVLILFVQALFFPCMLVLLFYSPFAGLLLLGLKVLSQVVLVRKMLRRLSEPPGFPFLGYELYSLFLSICLVIFYFSPIPVRWKGRRYQGNNSFIY